jgi:hypothetical protein
MPKVLQPAHVLYGTVISSIIFYWPITPMGNAIKLIFFISQSRKGRKVKSLKFAALQLRVELPLRLSLKFNGVAR